MPSPCRPWTSPVSRRLLMQAGQEQEASESSLLMSTLLNGRVSCPTLPSSASWRRSARYCERVGCLLPLRRTMVAPPERLRRDKASMATRRWYPIQGARQPVSLVTGPQAQDTALTMMGSAPTSDVRDAWTPCPRIAWPGRRGGPAPSPPVGTRARPYAGAATLSPHQTNPTRQIPTAVLHGIPQPWHRHSFTHR